MNDQIKKDVLRSIPGFVRARPAEAVRLFRILHAFDSDVNFSGYVQGVNTLGALCLSVVSDQERAYRLLHHVVSTWLPGYFSVRHHEAVARDGRVLADFVWSSGAVPTDSVTRDDVVRLCTLCVSQWFPTAFVNVLPLAEAVRVWDIAMFDGPRVLFVVATSIFCWQSPLLHSVAPNLEDALSDFQHALQYHHFTVEMLANVRTLSAVTIHPQILQMRRAWYERAVARTDV